MTTAVTQLTLFDLTPEPRLAAAAAATWTTTPAGKAMRQQLTAFANARGWAASTTQAVSHALAWFAAVGGFQATELVVSVDLAAQLRRRHLPVTRLAEFLTSTTNKPVRIERDRNHAASDGVPSDLPTAMRREVALWLDVLAGATGRGRAHADSTIGKYRRAALPAIGRWAGEYTSLRQVTSDDIAGWVQPLAGSTRVGVTVALRSLFTTLKDHRVIFTDPARASIRAASHAAPYWGWTRPPVAASSPAPTVSTTVILLLAGVHALTRTDITGLRIDDVDLARGSLRIHGRRIILDALTRQRVCRWLEHRRTRWPSTANPHLLITSRSAYGTGPVSTRYFRSLPIPISQLRADRLLTAAEDTGGDPLTIQRLFGVHPDTAVRYCTELLPAGQPPPSNSAHAPGAAAQSRRGRRHVSANHSTAQQERRSGALRPPGPQCPRPELRAPRRADHLQPRPRGQTRQSRPAAPRRVHPALPRPHRAGLNRRPGHGASSP
ncbi:site-specific integrase [Rhodococcus opacus]|nr:site-specific integrase [Rhodococcus opacus]